jgi:ATP phosphoribosyltransferase regulatory subunit
MPRWLLPENISDILPLEARRVEELRRALLDLYAGYGYELVIPPLIEYLDSLLTGTGSDLESRMFKLNDWASGRMLGLRADATPQVARIDAHILNRPGVARLCYAGSVLHARSLHPLAPREPLQVGAELYGYAGPAADEEVIELAVASMRLAGVWHVRLDVGHTAVVRALLDLAPPAEPGAIDELLAALTAKDAPTLRTLVAGMPALVADALLALVELSGGPDVIELARARLPELPGISAALDELARIARNTHADVSFDLADLHGYRYHSGLTFAVHVEGLPAAVLRGGRYDGIGKAFGRARPAVGFSIYLRDLAGLKDTATPRAVLAPAESDPALRALVHELRAAGEVVVQALPGAEGQAGDFEFDREIVRTDGNWSVVTRAASPAK